MPAADQLERLKAALSDRYAIEREVGAGGMATVYLARDIRHERKVAVKVLRPELAAALGPERFLREIRIAANLHHPHILPLYDSGEADGFLYYVMPYEQGQSLRDKLAKEGELPVTDAVRILRDVADALAHAHEQGVVHRDIKPDNVLLSGRHALVTDFGVAKAVSEATGRDKLTTAGVALGTPAYMAPEQATAHEHIDHRADIYAVGALAYELLAGRPPFLGTTPQMVLAAHVTEQAEPVRKYRDTIPAALDQLVMKCLEKKAADRWQSAEELLPQLEALTTPSAGMTPTGTMPVDGVAKRRWMAVGGVVGVAVVIAVIAVLVAIPRGTGVALDSRRVAVLPFANLTGEDSLDMLGIVAASWITDGLQRVDVLSVVPWTAVRPEINALEGGNPVRELANVTGAGVIISGSYSRHGDSLRFRAEITDTRRMEVQQTVPGVSGPWTNQDVVYEALSERVAGALAATLDTVFVFAQLFREPTFLAYKEYVTGEELFYQGRYREAIEHFTAAHELDTTFVGALFRAVPANINLGRYESADSLVELIAQFRDQLSTYERDLLALLQAGLQGNRLEVYRISREQFRRYPGTGYSVAWNAVRVNRPQEAVRMLEGIDPARGRMKAWVPYWRFLTQARHMLGDHRRELRDAQRGRKQHPSSRSTVEYEVQALAALGRTDKVRLVLDELLGLPPHPSWGHGYEAAVAGLEFRAHGFADAAREVLDLALDRLHALSPNEAQRRTYRYNLARTLYWTQRWEAARELFLQLATENIDDVDYAGYLGAAHARLGNAVEATRISDELAALDQPYLWGENVMWQARVAAVLGHREQAVELLRSAFNEGLVYGIWLHREIDLESLHDYPPFQALMMPKG